MTVKSFDGIILQFFISSELKTVLKSSCEQRHLCSKWSFRGQMRKLPGAGVATVPDPAPLKLRRSMWADFFGTAAAVPRLQTPMDGRFYNDQPLQKDIIFISALSAPASYKCTYHRWSGLRQMADAVNRFSWFVFIFLMVAVSAICQPFFNLDPFR